MFRSFVVPIKSKAMRVGSRLAGAGSFEASRGFETAVSRGLVGVGCVVVVAALLGGCTSISVAPSCPETLRVGDTGEVRANGANAGAIATHLWEVFPTDAGSFADPDAANTTFLAEAEGGVVIRLTASDGIWQVVEQCATTIEGFVELALFLTADPTAPVVGEEVTLACQSTGSLDAENVTIVQFSGETVDLSDMRRGTTKFTPSVAGDIVFGCTGEGPDGTPAESAELPVTIGEAPPDNENDNANDNTNANDNENDNANDNENDNDNGDDNANTAP